jgi:methyltransferase (TIGR00027 family)
MPELPDPLARTALWTASMRAREHDRPDRLFCDPLARVLAGDEGLAIMRGFEGDVQDGVEDPALAVRTRFFDDALARIVKDGNIRQIVLVAAGMDTRALRMRWPGGTTMYELDRPGLLNLKDQLISAQAAEPACRRILVGADLTADWTAPLLDAGLDPGTSTAWLAEGLLYFLSASQRDTLLHELTGLSDQGSWLMADYVGQASIDSPAMCAWRESMASRGHAWRSGCDDPGSWLETFGWHATVTGYGEPGADYGRWAGAEVAPGVAGTRGRYLVIASRGG